MIKWKPKRLVTRKPYIHKDHLQDPNEWKAVTQTDTIIEKLLLRTKLWWARRQSGLEDGS